VLAQVAEGIEASCCTGGERLTWYHMPADPVAEILLLRDRGFKDYALRVSEVLQALAAVERRTAWVVLKDFVARRHGLSPNELRLANT
jgi:hypothetical protein